MFGDEFRNRERAARGRRRGSNEGVAHRASDDHLHEFARIGFARLDRRQAASVAKDGHPVGDAQHFVQPMGHVDHANIIGAQATQRLEQALDVSLGKRCGRLVENDNVRLDRQRPADRDERAFGGWKRRDRGVGIEIAAHDRQRVRSGALNFWPRDEAAP